MIHAVRRPLPQLTTPGNSPGWDWNAVNRLLTRRTLLNFLLIAFLPWKTVVAPKGTPCALMNMREEPLYRFKVYRGRAYCLEMEPGIGFPGS